jgi:hypothetical protein
MCTAIQMLLLYVVPLLLPDQIIIAIILPLSLPLLLPDRQQLAASDMSGCDTGGSTREQAIW